MAQRSPTLEGFTSILRQPSFGVAEIAWRWSFGLAASLLVTFSFLEYLDTLPVTNRDLLFLRTGQPFLVSQALARIFQGSAPRLVLTALVLIPALAITWILLSSFARAATLKALVGYFRREAAPHHVVPTIAQRPMRSLVGINFLRVTATLAAAVAGLGAILLARSASPKTDPSPGGALLVFFTLGMMVWLAWSMVNWFLSLSAVFVVDRSHDTFGALAAAVHLCRTRTGSVLAAGTWFGIAHLTAFFVATSAIAFPLAFAGVLPTGVVLGGVLLVTLLYFAVIDFLYVGRLAAYVAILEIPVSQPSTPHPALGVTPSTSIDKDELILSDVETESIQHSALSIQPITSIDKDEPAKS